jgi:hypothetical protein
MARRPVEVSTNAAFLNITASTVQREGGEGKGRKGEGREWRGSRMDRSYFIPYVWAVWTRDLGGAHLWGARVPKHRTDRAAAHGTGSNSQGRGFPGIGYPLSGHLQNGPVLVPAKLQRANRP